MKTLYIKAFPGQDLSQDLYAGKSMMLGPRSILITRVVIAEGEALIEFEDWST